jgi:hypothetical protein
MTEAKKKPGTPSIARKLAEVALEVERIPKRGRNDFHNYDYATESDILAAVRKGLAERHVTLQPAVLEESTRSVGTKGHMVTMLKMQMQWHDGESGESMYVPWMGWGVDASDKGGYKAITGAEKYFLLKTFLIPTGDDPEVSSDADKIETTPRTDGAVAVTAIETKPTSRGGTRYLVHFSDGEKFATFDDELGNLAEVLKGTGEAVTYQTEQRGKWENLVAIERSAPDPARQAVTAKELADVAADAFGDPPHPADEPMPFETV